MGWIQDIAYKLKLPGLGLSEPFGTAYASGRSPQNVASARTNNSDPSGYGYDYTKTQDKTRNVLNQQGIPYVMTGGTNPSPNVNTNVNSGVGHGVRSDGSVITEADWQRHLAESGANSMQSDEERRYQQRVQAAKDTLKAIQDMVAKQIEQARGIYDEWGGKIKTTYGNLKTQAADKLGEIKAALGEEERGVVRDYGQANAKTIRAGEGVERGNANLARALGIADSSAFESKQSNLKNESLDKVLGLMNEQTAKQTGIAQRGTEATSWEAQQQQALDTEKASLDMENERTYKAAVDKAQFDERMYGIDNADLIEQYGYEYQQNSRAIQDYVANKAANVGAQYNTLSNASGANISGQQAVDSTLSGILKNTRNLTSAATPFSNQFGTAGTTGINESTSGKIGTVKQRDPYEEYMYPKNYNA